MQISMQLQSSTCFTTLHSTCSEVRVAVCIDVAQIALAAPAMLLSHESTVSHETQQEKGVLTARQLTATQELTNGGSKVILLIQQINCSS